MPTIPCLSDESAIDGFDSTNLLTGDLTLKGISNPTGISGLMDHVYRPHVSRYFRTVILSLAISTRKIN